MEIMEIVSKKVDESLKNLIVSEGLDPNDQRILSLAKKLSSRKDISEARDLESDDPIFEFKAIFEDLVLHAFRAFELKEVTVDPNSLAIENIKVLMINAKAKSIFGLSEGPLRQDVFYDQMRLMFDNSDELIKQGIAQLLSVGRITRIYSLEYHGEIRHFSSLIRLIRVRTKFFLVRVTNDISDVRNKEKIVNNRIHKLQDRKKELENYIGSNLQLENFAYIASHDLKAPLRTVLSFSQLIKRSSYDTLPDRDKKFLDLVIQSSNNMMLLIEDLIVFSRVNSVKIEPGPIEMGSFYDSVLINLASEFEKRDSEIKWNIEDQVIYADKSKLIQLFGNLIRNAIKFTEKDKKPVVEISMQETEDAYKFGVKDNGIGISEKHLKKIFGIFEKLHSKDVYEGTGLGLSICTKIVDQHGGTIWVESEEGLGSTFFFTLSKDLLAST